MRARPPTSITSALTTARAILRAAKSTRPPARIASAIRDTLSHADERVQEARTALERGDYLTVLTIISETLPSVQAAASELEAGDVAATRPRGSCASARSETGSAP